MIDAEATEEAIMLLERRLRKGNSSDARIDYALGTTGAKILESAVYMLRLSLRDYLTKGL